jgi:hypothetical protein
MEHYQAIMRLEPDSVFALNGIYQCQSALEYPSEETKKTLTQALGVDQDDAEANFNMGMWLYMHGP